MTWRRGPLPVYPDPEALGEKIAEYFDDCATKGKMPTVLGIGIHLGFKRRTTFCEYAHKGEAFKDVVDWAKMMIEDDRNQRLAKSDFSPGIIFDLKNNYQWTDKTQTELTGADGGPIQSETKLDVSALSEDQLRALASIKV